MTAPPYSILAEAAGQSGQRWHCSPLVKAEQRFLARAAGLEGERSGRHCDDRFLKTLTKNIYAVGDVIEVENFVPQTPAMILLRGRPTDSGYRNSKADNLGPATGKNTMEQ